VSRGARLRALLLDPRAQGGLLVAGAALIMLSRAGIGPLPNYDDAYYAEKAKQMLRTGDWLTPRFAGIERLDNPPMALWLMAASFAVLGVTSLAAVLWSALAGVACVWLTRRLALALGREPFEAWAAGLVLLGTGYFLKYANHAMFDVLTTLFFLGAILAYVRAAAGEGWRGWLVVGLATGLGVLTKSVLGVLPLLVIALHLLWMRRVTAAVRAGAGWAPVVAVLVVLPWYGYQLATHRDQFVREHIAWLLVQRGLGTGHEAASTASPFAYVREIATTYWPWLPFAAAGLGIAVRSALRRGHDAFAASLVGLWPLVVIGLLSLAHEKKLWYAMSAFPALALLSARAIAAWVRSPRARARTVLAGFAVVFTAGAVLALTPIGIPPVRRPDIQSLAESARSLVPAATPIAFAGGNYFSIAHQFVFYSDRRLVDGFPDAAALRGALDRGDWALASADRYTHDLAADSLRYATARAAGKWRLVRPPR